MRYLFNTLRIAASLPIILAALVFTGCAAKPETSAKAARLDSGSDLVIQVKDVTEKAVFYPMDIDGTELEVFAVKAADGTIRTAFNTCQVCYDSGRGYYKQDGDVFVCQNCGNRFETNQIEAIRGGCNPWPILPENKAETNETITISYDYLKEATAIFGNWKRE
ncbi:MAG: DUF2318 domain-containing protein [Clostridiales bacterium]|nr:DUF2318 domain-containing protein [Clostridiales bacterium]